MKCKRGSDGRGIGHPPLQAMRQQGVKAVGNGGSATAVAKASGVNVRSVFRWLADYASGGQKALQAEPIPGRPQKIAPDEIRWLAETLKDETPQQFEFEHAPWAPALVGEVLARQFGERPPKGSASRLMRIPGLTVQRPLYRVWQQGAGLVEQWREEACPAVRAEAGAAGAAVYFGEEAGTRPSHRAGATRAPGGQTPAVKATGRRFSPDMVSAASARGGPRFMVRDGKVDAGVFKGFLKRLVVGATQPTRLALDGRPTHKAKPVRDSVTAQKGKLKLFYLPPHSPQLNPDGQVWGNVKSRAAKQN